MSETSETTLSKENLRQAQKVMLYIMKKIHEVCVKHNIRYWLDYGTLLGAVRHDGFIPWDDDMDISMLREDYEKFNAIAQQELGEEFFWQTKETEPDFCFEMGKVRLNGTVWQERNWEKSSIVHQGLFVDIFPIDPFPESIRKVRNIDRKSKLYFALLLYKLNKVTSPNLVNKLITWILSPFFSRKRLTNWYSRKVEELSRCKDTSAWVSTICIDTVTHLCNKSVFDELILKKFEDTEFYIPAQYDERLKLNFGNYMQLPPEDKRYGHHGIIKIDFGKYDSI